MSECNTPGAVYSTLVRPTFVKVGVQLPFIMPLVPAEAEDLERDLHDAVSRVLAPYFLARKIAEEAK